MRSDEAVKDLKRFLDRNCHKQIRIGEVCSQRYVSEQYVCRRFRQIMGCSPKQYLMQMRLSNAAKRIATTDETICKAAFSCGFSDINNFCKQFRAKYGMTPTQYRAQNGQQ